MDNEFFFSVFLLGANVCDFVWSMSLLSMLNTSFTFGSGSASLGNYRSLDNRCQGGIFLFSMSTV